MDPWPSDGDAGHFNILSSHEHALPLVAFSLKKEITTEEGKKHARCDLLPGDKIKIIINTLETVIISQRDSTLLPVQLTAVTRASGPRREGHVTAPCHDSVLTGIRLS